MEKIVFLFVFLLFLFLQKNKVMKRFLLFLLFFYHIVWYRPTYNYISYIPEFSRAF